MTEPASAERLPVPLIVAAVLAALEGLVVLVYGFLQIPSITADRIIMGSTDTGFYLLYGGFLCFAAFRLVRGNSWAWAPIMLAQLLQIAVGLTWGNPAVAAVFVAPGVVAGVALLMPASIHSLRDNLDSRWLVDDSPSSKSGSPDEPDSPSS